MSSPSDTDWLSGPRAIADVMSKDKDRALK